MDCSGSRGADHWGRFHARTSRRLCASRPLIVFISRRRALRARIAPVAFYNCVRSAVFASPVPLDWPFHMLIGSLVYAKARAPFSISTIAPSSVRSGPLLEYTLRKFARLCCLLGYHHSFTCPRKLRSPSPDRCRRRRRQHCRYRPRPLSLPQTLPVLSVHGEQTSNSVPCCRCQALPGKHD